MSRKFPTSRIAVAVGLLAAATALSIAGPAQAACQWVQDCSTGKCRQVPICESTIDLPPLRPLELPQQRLPTVRPLDTPTLPPIGTKQCSNRYLCSGGQCSWQPVCR